MKKKDFWLYVWAALAVAVIVTWAIWPEYGKGYSEDQRRNWNEMVEATKENSVYIEVVSNISPKHTAALEKRKSGSDVPAWIPDFSLSSPALPIMGMRVAALKNLAEEGNGDACLELVFREFNDRTTSSFHSLSVVWCAEKYLGHAEKVGRPGACFLLDLLNDWKKNGVTSSGKNMEGYREFLSCMDAGDFALGKVYLYISSGGDDVLTRLENGLKRKAEKGDASALRDLGYLQLLRTARGRPGEWICDFFNKNVDYAHERYESVMDELKSIMDFLPDSLRLRDETIRDIGNRVYQFFRLRFLREKERSLKSPLKMLVKSAEEGDLHAKFLWNQYVVLSRSDFSREDWERHLRYANDLVRSGGIYKGRKTLACGYDSGFFIEYVSYQTQKLRDIDEILTKKEEEEDKRRFPLTAGTPALLNMDVSAAYDLENFMNDYFHEFSKNQGMSQEEKLYGCELIKRAATGGNPLAKLYVARMLNEGGILKMDAERSWLLLNEVKAWRDGIREKHIVPDYPVVFCEQNEQGGGVAESVPFHEVLPLLMMDVVSRHGNMLGMTVDDAFLQFIEMPSRSKVKNRQLVKRLREQFEKRGFKVPEESKK